MQVDHPVPRPGRDAIGHARERERNAQVDVQVGEGGVAGRHRWHDHEHGPVRGELRVAQSLRPRQGHQDR